MRKKQENPKKSTQQKTPKQKIKKPRKNFPVDVFEVDEEDKKPYTMEDFYRDNGIKTGERNEKTIMAYVLKRELRATLDRTKYPFVRGERIEENIYEDWNLAQKACKKIEKQNPEYIYFPHTIFIKESELKNKNLIKNKKPNDTNKNAISYKETTRATTKRKTDSARNKSSIRKPKSV